MVTKAFHNLPCKSNQQLLLHGRLWNAFVTIEKILFRCLWYLVSYKADYGMWLASHGRSTSQPAGWPAGRPGWLAGRPLAGRPGCLAGWRAGPLAGWLAGRAYLSLLCAWYFVLFHVLSCYFMLCYVISCYFVLFHAISC